MLDYLPANDKSFSRLFSEAPCLPDSAFKLLDDICCSDNNCGKDARDGDRVHQGLGSLWSLILGRPNNRQAFLDIALKVNLSTCFVFLGNVKAIFYSCVINFSTIATSS